MKKNTLLRKIDAFFIKKTRHIKKNSFLTICSHLGSFSIVAIYLIATFLIKFVNLKFLSLLSLLAIIFDTLIVFVIKYTCKRQRISKPSGIKYIIDPFSFPSGHVSRLATLAVASYSNIYFLIVISICMILCFFSRICYKYHYFSDCIVGMLIGIASSLIAIIITVSGFFPLRGILYYLGF